MRTLVLDSEAMNRLARASSGSRPSGVHAFIIAALQTDSDVVVPTAVLSELYRGDGYDAALDACLKRYPGIEVIDTNRRLAKTVGNLLADRGLGSAHHVDACVVASAIAAGGGVILTCDPDDIRQLAAGQLDIDVESL